jgi:hypothetical protein
LRRDGVRASVAYLLLIHPDMDRHPSPWRPLVPEALSTIPEAAGVFEVANLVRSVRFIDAGAGNLRERLAPFAEWQTKLPPSPGGYYFRYLRVDHEREALSASLTAYRENHRGLPPPMNSAQAERAPSSLRVERKQAA